MSPWSFDVFCRVVDNYGDIGVCWRLLQRLKHDARVGACRLWVDDLHSVKKIIPGVQVRAEQRYAGIDIMRWNGAARPGITPHRVVIEAFACDLPAWFLSAMQPDTQLWINLEYLSAESWIASCHGLPSLQSNGLRKYFYFPGFTAQTGGLIREPGLIEQRDRWMSTPTARLQFLSGLNIRPEALTRIQAGARLILLFCYPDAPVHGLIKALQGQERPSIVLVPEGVAPSLDRQAHSKVSVCEVPFISQSDFDRLLWSGDINIVRGEDSWVRAMWAGKPMIWQSYRQDDDAHIDKLTAWLDLAGIEGIFRQTMLAWNQHANDAFAHGLESALKASNWHVWQSASQRWSQSLVAQTDLGERLLNFCASTV